jgi:hypothetical protein
MSKRSRSVCSLSLVFLFVAACADRALELPQDAGTALDDGVLFCGLTHTRVPVVLNALALVGGGIDYFDDATVRLQLTYPLRACDVPADSVYTQVLDDGVNGVFTITAFVWMGSQDCGPSKEVSEVIPIPLLTDNAVLITDGAPMGSASLSLGLNATTPFCASPLVPTGQGCTEDCDCADTTALCLNGSDGIMRCGHSCNDDLDCRGAAEGASCYGAPTFMCGATLASCTPNDHPCGFGETVVACVCTRPAPMQSQIMCGCDADCTTGTLCNGQTCIIPCNGDTTCPVTSCEGEGCAICENGACTELL